MRTHHRYTSTHSILSNPLYVPGPHREKVKKKRVIRRKRERYRKNRGRVRKKEQNILKLVRDQRKKVKETTGSISKIPQISNYRKLIFSYFKGRGHNNLIMPETRAL